MISRVTLIAFSIVAILLCGCDRGPSEEDMAGCSVRGGGPPISSREVAECAVDRAGKHEEKRNEQTDVAAD